MAKGSISAQLNTRRPGNSCTATSQPKGTPSSSTPTPTPSSNKAVLASRRGKTNSDKCAQMSALTSANDKAITSSGSTVTLLISAASACQRDTAGHHAGLRQPGGLMSVTEEVSPFMAWILIKSG